MYSTPHWTGVRAFFFFFFTAVSVHGNQRCKHKACGHEGACAASHAHKNSQRCQVEVPVFPMRAEYLTIYIHTNNLGNRRRKEKNKTQSCKNRTSSAESLSWLCEVKECVEFGVTVSLHGRHSSDVTQVHKHAQIRPGCERLWHHSPAQRACVCMCVLSVCGVISTEYRPVEVWALHCSWILLPCFHQVLLSQCKQKSSWEFFSSQMSGEHRQVARSRAL